MDFGKVFVICGRDQKAHDVVFDILVNFGLRPFEWEDLVASGGNTLPFLLDVIIAGISSAQAVICVLTAEDVVSLHASLHDKFEFDYEVVPALQPRPNVLIELGIALGLCRDRTVILEFGQLRPIADVAGLNLIRFDGTNSRTAIAKLAKRLLSAGCAVERTEAAAHADICDQVASEIRKRRPPYPLTPAKSPPQQP